MTKAEQNEYSKQRYANNREQLKEYARNRRKNCAIKISEIQRKCDLKRRFGITLDEYNKMLSIQSGKCAICNRDASIFKRRLSVDHDHKTGRIRGLLCLNCNIKLGHFESCLPLINKLKKYIDEKEMCVIV